jgi:hypothetical protein
MASGHVSALSIISWEGYLSAMFGNTLMCSHFAASGERSAVNVQLVGILNNFLILTQVGPCRNTLQNHGPVPFPTALPEQADAARHC